MSDVHNAEYGKNNRRLVQNLVEIASCYYVTGNHEAWRGEQYQELEKILLDEGVTILHDEAVQITRNNETIQLAGLDDPDFADGALSAQQNILEARIEGMGLTDDYCVRRIDLR